VKESKGQRSGIFLNKFVDWNLYAAHALSLTHLWRLAAFDFEQLARNLGQSLKRQIVLNKHSMSTSLPSNCHVTVLGHSPGFEAGTNASHNFSY
jgi:hypothetical protein